MLLNLLKSLADQRAPLRPPGALGEVEFTARCIRCRKCEEVCPYGSIKIADLAMGIRTGTPYIVPREEPCWLCDDLPCIDVCPTEALAPVESRSEIKMGIAYIDETLCFAYNGILCRACYERCPIYGEAITLEQELYPKVHADKCVGCGICEMVCPVEPLAVMVTADREGRA